MRKYEQREVWAHGMKFIVRRAPADYAAPARQNWRRPVKRGRIPEQYVLFAEGRFVARLRKRDIKRWINHFALKGLLP